MTHCLCLLRLGLALGADELYVLSCISVILLGRILEAQLLCVVRINPMVSNLSYGIKEPIYILMYMSC